MGKLTLHWENLLLKELCPVRKFSVLSVRSSSLSREKKTLNLFLLGWLWNLFYSRTSFDDLY